MTGDCNKRSILQGVVAFVDVWSSNKTENYSKSFIEHLVDMGATVLKYFNKQVTHVIFKDGHESVWKKAQKTGVKLVSVLWVERCLATHTHVDESLFPAINESKHLPENKRTHRCMKPKDFIEKTPENNKRLQKKLDQMIQELDLKRSLGADLPSLSFEEEVTGLNNAKPKSVPLNRFCGMEERLKEMKEKRENLSPTASQMTQLTVSASAVSPCRPTLGESPSAIPKALFEEEYEVDSGGASINNTCGKYAGKSKTPLSADAYEGQMSQHHRTEPFVQGMHLIKSSQDENKTSLRRGKKSISKMKLHFPKSALASLHRDKVSAGSCNKKVSENYSEGSVEVLNNAGADLNLCDALSNKIVQSPPPVKSTATVEDHYLTETDFVSNEHYKNYASPLQSNFSTVMKKNQCSSKKNGKLCKDHFKSTRNDISEAGNFPNKEEVCPTNKDRLMYEDFFSTVNLNGQNNPRLSLGVLPPKSPSPPGIIFGNVKQKRKLQEIDPQISAARNKRARSAGSVSVEAQPSVCTDKDNEPLNAAALAGKNSPDRSNATLQSDAAKSRQRRKSHLKELFKYFLDESRELMNEVSKKKELCQRHEEKRLDLLPNHSTMTCLSKRNKGIKPSNLHHEPQTYSIISMQLSDQMNKKGYEEEKVQCHQEDTLSKDFLKLQSVDNESDDDHQSGPSQSSPLGLKMTCFLKEKHNLIEVTNRTIECKRKNMKPRRTLVMTSMPSENQTIVIQIVKQLGGFLFSDSVCETTTHVIAGRHRRTLNVLFGIARGCWILSFDWILWSLEKGCWAPEEPFELSAQFPAATICRLEKQSTRGPYQQDLFVNQPLMFISPQSKPPALMLEKLVQLCGGKVCKTLRKAGICIGQYTGRRPPGNKHLSEHWILDSITKHEVCSMDGYTLD
ncbi:microcephalin isoform X1 [Pristis pectinata]|uniref:microcephalin isoform X1 n=1 Tax=Pristis pectinata TaxID=685728 RepID=UPI00223DF23B|nr:microcephalin isoform X1 [Pristis pectinata]XP_051881037.1 microcephalin isoform X1 [Pristis pectinata]